MLWASWGERVGAYLLDGVILSGVIIATIITMGVLSAAVRSLGWLFGLVGVVIYLGTIIGYMLLEAGPYGQTPGKWIVGIRVVDSTGRPLSMGRSVGRYFGRILSALPFYLGFLWPLWDDERRAIHDMVCETRVIRDGYRAPSLIAAVRGPFRGA